MFYVRNALEAQPNMRAHFDQMWASRQFFMNSEQQMLNAAVAAGFKLNLGITKDYWAAFDTQAVELRNTEDGMEIVNDLLPLQTVLPVGKTVKFYNQAGEIADDVVISIDGQAPYSFDHTDYAQDGDPIPIIQAGFGVNWRHFQGLQSEGIDLALDSRRAKQREFNKKLVGLMLDGAPNIVVADKPSQGLRTHRNTKKINLGAGGANINLTTATVAQLIAFFQGVFATTAVANRVSQYDVLWVSPEIMTNLGQVYVENGVTVGTARDYLLRFIRARDIRESFALSGNEFLGYVRDRDVVTPLVGMPIGTLPLPRPLPETNYNFRIMGAMGLQVKADSQGLGGVIYGADLT